MSSKDGMKERYISLPHTNIRITQTDMQEMICTQKRSEELLPGKLFFSLSMKIGKEKLHKFNLN